MQVHHILTVKGHDIVSVNATSSIAEAAALLSARRIGAVLVKSPDGILSGILSERDVVHGVARDGALALAKPVSHYMTPDPVTCREHDTIDALMELMTNGRFRHLPVTRDGALIGIVSIGDVVKTHIEETEREARSLREYIAT